MIKCELCPLCGQQPLVYMHPEQAICSNEDCPVITWNPAKTLDENLLQANVWRFR